MKYYFFVYMKCLSLYISDKSLRINSLSQLLMNAAIINLTFTNQTVW